MTRIMGFAPLKPRNFSPSMRLPLNSSRLIGVPVCMPLLPVYLSVSSNVTRILSAYLAAILFASPGVKSDSWQSIGHLPLAAMTTGTLTNPPLEKTKSGLICLIISFACEMPLMTLKESVRFFSEK